MLMNNCIISNLLSAIVVYQPVDVYKVCTMSKHACNLQVVHILLLYSILYTPLISLHLQKPIRAIGILLRN